MAIKKQIAHVVEFSSKGPTQPDTCIDNNELHVLDNEDEIIFTLTRNGEIIDYISVSREDALDIAAAIRATASVAKAVPPIQLPSKSPPPPIPVPNPRMVPVLPPPDPIFWKLPKQPCLFDSLSEDLMGKPLGVVCTCPKCQPQY